MYTDAGLSYIWTKDSSDTEPILYQCYIKHQKNQFEIKAGKLVYIPGFVGLFNPFYKTPAFETIVTELEGEKGIFLRFNNELATPSLFVTVDEGLDSPVFKFEISQGIKKFETGIYLEGQDNIKGGIYTGYFGNFTLKIQGFLADSVLKFTGNLEFPVKKVLASLWIYATNFPEVSILPGSFLLTKHIAGIELKFPEMVFEVPYILVFYDIDNKTSRFIFDLRYTISNNLLLEAGITADIKNHKIKGAIFGGFKFTKGF